jgi:hypothetical protein
LILILLLIARPTTAEAGQNTTGGGTAETALFLCFENDVGERQRLPRPFIDIRDL